MTCSLEAAPASNLALLYHGQGKYDLAQPLFQQAVAGVTGKLGFDHPRTQLFIKILVHLYDR